MLLITAPDARGLVNMEEALKATEAAFHAWAQAEDSNRPRQRVHAGPVRVSVHPGGSSELGYAGVFIHCEYVTMQGHKQVTVRRPQATVLYDGASGELEGMIIGPLAGERVDLRTAATSAFGTRLVARPDADVLGLFGAGKQAIGHLRAFCLAMPQLREIRVFSPTEKRRRAFAASMSQELGRPVRAVDHPRQAIEGADIILGATNTNVPLFDGAWLAPGQHVTSIAGSNAGLVRSGVLDHKRRELDDATLERANRIVLVSKEQAIQDEQGEIFDPIERGVITWEKVVELRDVVAGTAPGREDPTEITVLMNNAGQGVVDVAIAGKVLDAAKRRGLGTRVDISALKPEQL